LGPGISYIGPSSYRKKNLLGHGLTEVENHWNRGCLVLEDGERVLDKGGMEKCLGRGQGRNWAVEPLTVVPANVCGVLSENYGSCES
jgi:hypothetical protein